MWWLCGQLWAEEIGARWPSERMRTGSGSSSENVRGLLGYALRRVPTPLTPGTSWPRPSWRLAAVEDVPAGDEARLGCSESLGTSSPTSAAGCFAVRTSPIGSANALADLVVIDHASTVATGHVLRAAMSRLDADDRKVLWLTSWEGLTPGQVLAGTPYETAAPCVSATSSERGLRVRCLRVDRALERRHRCRRRRSRPASRAGDGDVTKLGRPRGDAGRGRQSRGGPGARRRHEERRRRARRRSMTIRESYASALGCAGR